MNVKYLFVRNGTYYYRRVFPAPVRERYSTGAYVVSLGTQSLEIALIHRAEHNRKFEALLEGDNELNLSPAFEKLTAVASRLDFAYRPIDFSVKPIDPRALFEELLPGLEALVKLANPSKYEIAAVAGIAKQTLTFAAAFEIYSDLSKDRWMSYSTRERDKKVRPIEEAVADFMMFMPVHDVLTLTKKEAYRYRDRLIAQVTSGIIKPETANRKIMRLRSILSRVFEVHHPNLSNPFVGVKIAELEPSKRPPFSEDEIEAIRQVLNSSDANDEIKAIIQIAMHTGATPKELVLMEKEDICLADPVPHIRIRPNVNRTKVKSGGARHRDVPLLCDALTWMARFPEGFPRYKRDNGGEAASAAANKLIKRATNKTFYSFRHRIKDLMRDAMVADSIQDSIMGHTERGMSARYGKGYTLTVKRDELARALNLTP
ncbi:hypothetical protein ASC97_20575 [Rhizobium sp. Root1203]|uniref:DUF6538 domain-containing protein n=1 Tax=Rhizobium sp. Root1203 TaxID=1736427 RepID=UPI00070C6274|nr:DUF6538 domain-containing protein [Rhizobium sp. Root1203]KQV30601.1 hypothetical protein ASC97_20575 [Rhizobium sp. Root1203]